MATLAENITELREMLHELDNDVSQDNMLIVLRHIEEAITTLGNDSQPLPYLTVMRDQLGNYGNVLARAASESVGKDNYRDAWVGVVWKAYDRTNETKLRTRDDYLDSYRKSWMAEFPTEETEEYPTLIKLDFEGDKLFEVICDERV